MDDTPSLFPVTRRGDSYQDPNRGGFYRKKRKEKEEKDSEEESDRKSPPPPGETSQIDIKA